MVRVILQQLLLQFSPRLHWTRSGRSAYCKAPSTTALFRLCSHIVTNNNNQFYCFVLCILFDCFLNMSFELVNIFNNLLQLLLNQLNSQFMSSFFAIRPWLQLVYWPYCGSFSIFKGSIIHIPNTKHILKVSTVLCF